MNQRILGNDKHVPLGPGIMEYTIIVALFAMGVTGVFTALYGTTMNHESEQQMNISTTSVTTERGNTATATDNRVNQDNGLVSYSVIVNKR